MTIMGLRDIFIWLVVVNVAAASNERDEALFDLIRQDSVGVRSFREKEITISDHRRLKRDYSNACQNPGLLYIGTGDSGRCACDDEYEHADRVLCIVEGLSCTDSICTQEQDIWIFDKFTGKMSARSTCVVCSDEPETCRYYDNTCFHARFDEDHSEMVDCSLILQDTKPTVSCTNCSPCFDEGKWGMQFNCFEGRWNSNDSCIVGSRVGHIPEFLVPAEIGSITYNNNRTHNRGSATQKKDSAPSIFTLLIISLMLGLSMGIFISLRWNRTPPDNNAPPMEDTIDKDDNPKSAIQHNKDVQAKRKAAQ